jgi:hypothetical protein
MALSIRLATLLLGCALVLPTAARSQAPPSEEAVKAAYLVKLRNYVEWPAKAPAPADSRIVIGVVGADAVADHLQKMPAVRDPAKSSVALKRLRPGDPVAGVHILYVGDEAWSRAAPMVAQAREQSALVVSDAEGALAGGSVINFRLVDERIRFEISLDAADKSNLKLSSQLLTLALSVARKGR